MEKEEKLKELVGNKIRLLRESKGWTQEDLGLKIGVDQSNITRIEKGKKFISMDKIYKILNAFDISFDYLFEDVLVASQNLETNDSFYSTIRNSLNVMCFEDLKMTKKLIQEIYGCSQSIL